MPSNLPVCLPLIKLEVSNVSDEQCNTLLPALSKMLAEITGKPEKYVMATMNKTTLMMAGKPGPAAFADIRGIGGWTPAVNKKASQAYMTFIGLGLMRLFWKPLSLPALAWPFHIFLDIFTHPLGRFQTPFLYPISDLAFNGISWWMHPWFIRAYWGLLPLIWLGIVMARRRRTSKAKC